MTLADIRSAIAVRGLAWRGAFHPQACDLPAGLAAGTLVLVGCAGHDGWAAFSRSPEFADGAPDPLDRWSRRAVGGLAHELGATALFPFEGPPWLPFQRWARKAEPLHPSPLGMLIHPDWGLWHSWRGALAFAARIDLPEADRRPSPCDGCSDKPCLSGCPVNAFTSAGYDVATCASHLRAPEGADCMDFGCAARRACPVGREHVYGAEQARFHMEAFRTSQPRSCV